MLILFFWAIPFMKCVSHGSSLSLMLRSKLAWEHAIGNTVDLLTHSKRCEFGNDILMQLMQLNPDKTSPTPWYGKVGMAQQRRWNCWCFLRHEPRRTSLSNTCINAFLVSNWPLQIVTKRIQYYVKDIVCLRFIYYSYLTQFSGAFLSTKGRSECNHLTAKWKSCAATPTPFLRWIWRGTTWMFLGESWNLLMLTVVVSCDSYGVFCLFCLFLPWRNSLDHCHVLELLKELHDLHG